MNRDLIVRQSNDFIESAFAQEYSEQEIKTMEFIISQTTKADIELYKRNELKHIVTPVEQFANLIGANPKQIYRDADHLCKSLLKKQYHFQWTDEKGKKSFKMGNFFTDITYSNGIISLSVNPFVLPYFVDINEWFTEFNLRHIVAIGSSYGIKLYKLLKQWQWTAKREFTIEELRRQFGIDETKYNTYSNFKLRVIDIALKHINSHTDISVRYEEIKTSRKITSLFFYIHSKDNQEKQAVIVFMKWLHDHKDKNTGVIIFEKMNVDNKVKQILKDTKDILKILKNKDVKKLFDSFIDNYIYNYDPKSCTQLNVYGDETLFGNE